MSRLKLAKNFIRDLRRDWPYIEQQLNYSAMGWGSFGDEDRLTPKMTRDFWLAKALLEEVHRFFWSVVVHCRHKGKHWHDEGWAGPDSGGMGGYCDRCRFGFETVLY